MEKGSVPDGPVMTIRVSLKSIPTDAAFYIRMAATNTMIKIKAPVI